MFQTLCCYEPPLSANAFDLLLLIPVGLTTLFGGERSGQIIFQGKCPESAGVRTILGSLWTAIFAGSVARLFHPVSMSPLLLIQVIYNTLWPVVFVLPLVLRGQGHAVPREVAGTFLVIVVRYPCVISWGRVFGG
jgi:hypothetical protein